MIDWQRGDISGWHVRSCGSGFPLVFLHGGWGYGVYPIDVQARALRRQYRVIVPDRRGYGRSGPPAPAGAAFHPTEAADALRLLDALGIQRAHVWGHSDGAVAAVWMALDHPQRVSGVVLEALHHDTDKRHSRRFFEAMRDAPESFGSRTVGRLRDDLGEGWRQVLAREGRVWLELIANAASRPDLYDGRLNRLISPVLVLHGRKDPRTEPGEFARIRAALPDAAIATWAHAGHSPHSQPDVSEAVTDAITDFLRSVDTRRNSLKTSREFRTGTER